MNKKIKLGMFFLSGSSFLAEACSKTELDWILFDTEASAFSKKDILHMLQSLNGSKVNSIVRIEQLSKHLMEFYLDLGVKGILVPKVNNATEAKKVVDACFYPPKGTRGINPIRASNYFQNIDEYLSKANDNILTMIQIESIDAIHNIEQIARVKGIEVLFIGPGDLASSLGQPGLVTGDRMDDCRHLVLKACKKYNKRSGIFAYSIDLAKKYINEGFEYVAIGNDIKFIMQKINSDVSRIKENI